MKYILHSMQTKGTKTDLPEGQIRIQPIEQGNIFVEHWIWQRVVLGLVYIGGLDADVVLFLGVT